MDAAVNAFYHTYDVDDRSDVVSGIMEQLDFHPLSVTLLATVAHQNRWDTGRLATEWEKRRTSVLQTEHATIELSPASPMFQQIGHDARALLGVVAFLPQGVGEDNLNWLFPTITNITDVFNNFCILSLAYRSNGSITTLAPLRDYLSPKDPMSSPLFCTIKECCFARMSNFGETRWVASEEANVEHLLDVFTKFDGDSSNVWGACTNFMRHFFRHKTRFRTLRLKIEGLPDDHPSKPRCLFELSWLGILESDGAKATPYSWPEALQRAGRRSWDCQNIGSAFSYQSDNGPPQGRDTTGEASLRDPGMTWRHGGPGGLFGRARSVVA